MQPICYIVSAMPAPDLCLPRRPGDLLVAADAGYRTLRDRGIEPDLVVGDFDSMGRRPDHPHVIQHPVVKNDTDTLLAARIGVERGYRRFVFFGALGGLLDHTWANCQTLLWLLEQGAQGFLLGEGQCVTALGGGGALRFSPANAGRLSVFSAGDRAEGVTLRGLTYCLEGAELRNSFPLGVSNAFKGERAEIALARGTLLVMWQQRPDVLLERLLAGGDL